MQDVTLPRLAVTLGDPAGIGPELVLRALADKDVAKVCRLFVYGNRQVLMRVAKAARIPFSDSVAVLPPSAVTVGLPETGHLLFDFPCVAAETLLPGCVQATCGAQAYQFIASAVGDALAKRVDALVTAPICKEALYHADIMFPGHTEMLGYLTGTPNPCMVFHSPAWIMGLVTIHVALAEVPRLLTIERVLHTIRLTHQGCLRFGKPEPRIGVLAFNPHAGEQGLFGDEEARVIMPAIARATSEGVNVSGPLVPDTAFIHHLRSDELPAFDAYVAMYHDQGLIPFKMMAFDTGVNVTMGLPFIRTSPDHGTAFGLAWQGRASAESFLSAIRLASV